MNPIHRETCRAMPKTAIHEHIPLPELMCRDPASRREAVDHEGTDDHVTCLEKIVLNSDLDFF